MRVTVEDIFKAGKTINVAVIAGSTPECLLTQIAAAQHFADMIELRLDLSPKLSPEIWQVCLTQIKLPWLLTYRSQAEGGFGDHASDIRIGMVERFVKLKPSLAQEFLLKIRMLNRSTYLLYKIRRPPCGASRLRGKVLQHSSLVVSNPCSLAG